MDVLIAETTFVHDDAHKRDEFIQVLERTSRNSETSSLQDILKVLAILEKKLTERIKPACKTKGWEQALDTYQVVARFCGNILYSNETIRPDVQAGFFSFMVHVLQNDLNMLHMQVAYECLQDGRIELKAYIQKLDDISLKPLMSAACHHVEEEKGVDKKAFGDTYQKFIRQLVRDTLLKEQIKQYTNELLDLSIHCYLGCGHFHEDAYKRISDTGKIILDVLDDPFTSTNDFSRIKSVMKKCGEIIKQSSFPPSEVAARVIKDFIGSFVTKLAKRGLVEEIYNELFDLILDATKCPYHEDRYDIYLFEEVYGFFRRIPNKTLTKNADLFKAMAKRYSVIIDELSMRYLTSERFACTVLDDGLQKVYADNKEVARQWLELLIPLFKKPCEDTMRASYTIICNNKGYKWKDHADIAHQVFDLIITYQSPDNDDQLNEDEKKKFQEFLKSFKSAVEYFFEGLKKSRMLKDFGKGMLKISLKFLESKNTELLELSEAIAERTELNPKEDKEFMVDMMKQFHVILKNEDHLWNESWPLQRAANDFIDHCLEPFKDGRVFTDDELSVFVSICLTCLDYDCVHPETGQFPSHYFSVFLSVIKVLSKWLVALNKLNLAADLVPKLMKCIDSEDENVVLLCAVYMFTFSQAPSGHEVAAPYLDKLIQVYLDKRQDQLLYAISEIYPSNPKALKNHYRSLMDLLEETGETTMIQYLGMLFQKVSKKQAELFTEQDIEMLLKKAQENLSSQSVLLDIPKELCKRRPESMIPHIDLLLDRSSWNPIVSYWITDMLCTLAIFSKDLAPRVLDDLFLAAKSGQDKSTLLTAFNGIRMIGFKYPDLLKPRRAELNDMQLTDVDAINIRQTILDMIDGKTSEDMLNQLKKQQEDIQDLVGRVDETEDAVAEVKDELGKQGEQMNQLKNEVGEQGEHLNQLEQTIEETVEKVEEIDQKTLSHAPYWARDVSKLLNPASDHDWRLLSSRLGYSNDDIRGWAQQSDPCMAMLNEWYAARKTSEATFAILTQLQEMDRMDAAIIVENAMKNAEAVVEDDSFEYASPPPIFISYQWAHQPEVKLLKQHLGMAGYDCWLDIGQMGGGDKLFEKIDKGIRAAKAIICCVTGKYAKSPNCNREVNLAVSLNKPVIPLLLETCPWPPPGSMGPIFSEYLFVRFFQRSGEETSDERFWPKEKFQELLMQLSTFGLPPEESKIESEYKNWWMPVIKEIKIDKSKTKGGGHVAQVEPKSTDVKAAESPDIFISYQWGKQKNIIRLYERLTSLRFSCWLDIKQMGAGDSLYDKIDRGIRGCKVVLSCVTQKYALSANCRREVSLADALKKPLLPLLLEQMTWPPPGPMSMAMTQLLYINFIKNESVQMSWDGPEFEELITKIREHVQYVSDVNQTQETSQNNKELPTKSEGKGAEGSSPIKKNEDSLNLSGTKQPKTSASSSRSQNLSIKATKTQKNIASIIKPPVTKLQAGTVRTIVVPTQQEISTKKLALAKVNSVTRISAVSKPVNKAVSSHHAKTEPFQLAVSSRQLLKPISSDSSKNLSPPTPEFQLPSKAPVKKPASQQYRAAQRPSRLPPLHHSQASDTQSSVKNPSTSQVKLAGKSTEPKKTSK